METTSCHLPPEIVFKTFSHLTSDQLRCLVVPVSDYWSRLTYDPTLWKNIHLDGRKEFPHHTRKIFQNSDLVQNLEFSNVSNWNLAESLPKWNCLRSISFEACKINASEMKMLVTNFPFVDKIHLAIDGFDEDVVKEILRWQFLKHISIHNTDETFVDGSESLELIADNCKFLKCVEFGSKISVDEQSFLYFTNLRASAVETLFVAVNFETMGGIQSLEHYTSLTKLKFRINPAVPDLNLLVLKKLSLLEELTIYRSTTSEIYATIFKGTIFHNLKKLKFAWCPEMDDLCVKYLAKSCPFLRILEIFNCQKITEEGLVTISNHCRYLEDLSISGLDITCECIANNIQYLPRLIYLGIDWSDKVTDETILKITAQRHDITISCPDSELKVGKNVKKKVIVKMS